jgi:hypothetical protein
MSDYNPNFPKSFGNDVRPKIGSMIVVSGTIGSPTAARYTENWVTGHRWASTWNAVERWCYLRDFNRVLKLVSKDTKP